MHTGRVPDRERLIVPVDHGQIGPAGDNRRLLLAWAGHLFVPDDSRVTGWLGGV